MTFSCQKRIPMKDNKFHRHLDVCEQCARNPMGLCGTGARLLREEAERSANEALGPLRKHFEKERKRMDAQRRRQD